MVINTGEQSITGPLWLSQGVGQFHFVSFSGLLLLFFLTTLTVRQTHEGHTPSKASLLQNYAAYNITDIFLERGICEGERGLKREGESDEDLMGV